MAAATPPQLVIRNVDPDLWRRVRAEAVRHGTNAGSLLNEVMRDWLARHDCEAFTMPPSRP